MALLMRRICNAFAVGVIAISMISNTEPALAGSASASRSLGRWQADIAGASHRFGIPQSWIRAVIKAESGGDPSALSLKGAMGLMQIMPQTWADLRARYGVGVNSYDPHANILAGTAYLRQLYECYGYPNLFAAYNAGPKRLDAYLFDRQPLPEETINYLMRLGRPQFSKRQIPFAKPAASLFFPLHTGARHPQSPSSDASPSGLFVPLNPVMQSKNSFNTSLSNGPNLHRK